MTSAFLAEVANRSKFQKFVFLNQYRIIMRDTILESILYFLQKKYLQQDKQLLKP